MKTGYCKAAVILGVFLLLGGCTTEYLITKPDGTIIESYGKPRVDETTGMITYRDAEGRKMQMHKEDIVQIIER